MRTWFRSGDPWLWLTASAVAVSTIMVMGLLGLIAARGLGYFWPSDIHRFEFIQGGMEKQLIGEIKDNETVTGHRLQDSGVTVPDKDALYERLLVKVGNRDLTGIDFVWFPAFTVRAQTTSGDLVVIERREWGNAYGVLRQLMEDGQTVSGDTPLHRLAGERLERALELHARIRRIEKDLIGAVNYRIERLRLRERGLELKQKLDDDAREALARERAVLDKEYAGLQQHLERLYSDINRDALVLETSDGRTLTVPLAKVVRITRPNAMGVFAKTGHYLAKIWEFVSDEPREANTEGGIFPAIFGTVMMVIVMSIIVTPFGVIAAVYLREYAKQGLMNRLIRIAVNNLAGVPSIVYGVFGLGFFVYFLGGSIDRLFYPEAHPAPTFGTPGLLWSSLTLAILTLPVVIVATEEGLARIPRSVREGSLALGATKAETLWRTVLPMASPAMMTGLILAVARAAGEVAPLMLVGVVKLAPSLPLDANAPFLHLERKFMHLGFHIYDVGFQSPNVEAARPLVYATSLLLVVVIIALNLAAIAIRNRLREKYRSLEG